MPAFGFAAVVAAFGRSWKLVVAFVLPAAVIVLPYVIGLHSSAGVWALSLKPQWNVLKNSVYASEPGSYVDRRLKWHETREALRNDDGGWDIKTLASVGDTASLFEPKEARRLWIQRVASGVLMLDRTTAFVLFAGIVGLAGGARGHTREYLLALATLLPIAVIPLFANLFGRYVLPLLPGLAWGTGTLVACLTTPFEDRVRTYRTVVLGASVIALVPPTLLVLRNEPLVPFESRSTEIEVLYREGRYVEAEHKARAWVRRDADIRDARTLAAVLEATGVFRPSASESPDTKAIELLLEQGDYDKAERYMDLIEDEFAHRSDFWLLRGRLAFEQDQWSIAASAFERSARLGQQSHAMSLVTAICLLRAGRLSAAAASFAHARESGDAVVRSIAESYLAEGASEQ